MSVESTLTSNVAPRAAPQGWTVIVNPAAGGGRCGKRAPAALERLRASGLALDVHHTTGPAHATRLARDAWTRGARRFLAVGGDGTTHEILNGLFPEALGASGADAPTIAMLPLGTGNSFLRDFAIHGEADALSAIQRGVPARCDVMRIAHARGELWAINILGVGFSAEVGALTNRRYKHLGALGYIVSVLRTAARLRYPTFPHRLDGAGADERPAVLLSFCNSRCTGGAMQMAPRARVDDGELDVIRIGAMPRLRFVAAFPSIFRGTHVALPEVEQQRARRVDFELASEVDCMIDGEVVPLSLRSVEVVPGAVSVIA